MFKHIIALIAFSTLIVLSMSHAQQAIQILINAHDWVAELLTGLFSGGQAGNLARGLIALLAIPFVAAFIPTVIYWAIRRDWFPYFLQIVWVVWLLQAGALLMLSRAI